MAACSFVDPTSEQVIAYTSPTPTSQEKHHTSPRQASTFTAKTKHEDIAAQWGVMPDHMDYKSKLPKLWVESEEGGNIELSPWALAWFDKQPQRLDDFSEEYAQAYKIGFKDPRVKVLVDVEPEIIFRSISPQFYIRSDQNSEDGTAIEDLQRASSNVPKNMSHAISEEYKPENEDLLYPGFDPQTTRPNRLTGLGLHPVTTWGEVPDHELNFSPPLHADNDDSSLFSSPPKQDEPQPMIEGISSGPTSSEFMKSGQRGMPIRACHVDRRYRPKPWGNGEGMP
ncbi:Nn.00g030740.m01.CDS01 [Neocucurbitaria sp. VM-36]